MPCSQLRFLVVEDHEFQRTVMVELLESLGAEAVLAAEDGRKALQLLRDPASRIDIVISDLSMPEMDGMELVRHLGETGSQVSLIVASGLEARLLSAVANMALAFKVRLLGVISKPPSAAKLRPLVELHRAGTVQGGASGYPLDEIAASWTNGDFEPWFEPQVELETGVVSAMHAAARWRHPTQGLLPAETFMPSIRARGLAEDFGWLILQRSVEYCADWVRQGLDVSVSVGVLFDSWADVALATRVKQVADKAGVHPARIHLSVAEPAVRIETARALENLARLRVYGFGLTLDEFGSGEMAVDRLAQVAFTHLRVRNAFVVDADRDESARAGLAVALELATQLKLKAIGDGIVRPEEWMLLREWGCHLGQGPLVSEPLEGDAVVNWTREWVGARI